ncbi:MAG: NAD(+) synthase [Bacilli bacterium]|nr:NAD(+) synthase [Bacilli bacterium]
MKEELATWIKKTVGDCTVVLGISGGKDSSVAAAICAYALGREKVVGVLMPDGEQHDIDKSKKLVDFLGIKNYTINIKDITEASRESIRKNVSPELTYQLRSNLAARIRMTTLYNVAAMIGNARVVNTCNKSEDYVGYSTKFGDAAGDFSPLGELLVCEVKALGYELGLPVDLIEKVPEDGLSGKTDEDNLGFTYAFLDHYILTGEGDKETVEKIEKLHRANLHKLLPMPKFEPKR